MSFKRKLPVRLKTIINHEASRTRYHRTKDVIFHINLIRASLARFQDIFVNIKITLLKKPRKGTQIKFYNIVTVLDPL